MNIKFTNRCIIVATAVMMYSAHSQANTATDPQGDAITPFAPPPALDIATVSAEVNNGTLTLHMTFFNSISAPSAEMPNGIVGEVHLDTDQNPATGVPAGQTNLSPLFPAVEFGAEYLFFLSSEPDHPGEVEIRDTSDNSIVGTVPVTYGEMSLTAMIPLSMLGDDDGNTNVAALIGTFAQPTDATNEIACSVVTKSPSADLDGNGMVGGPDLLILLNDWGLCPLPSTAGTNGCPADLDSNGTVSGTDLLILLNAWG